MQCLVECYAMMIIVVIMQYSGSDSVVYGGSPRSSHSVCWSHVQIALVFQYENNVFCARVLCSFEFRALLDFAGWVIPTSTRP